MLRRVAACALLVLASVVLSAEAQVRETKLNIIASEARASPPLAQCAVLCTCCVHEATDKGTQGQNAALCGQGDADGMKAAVHQAALQKSQHASVGIGASDSDPAQDKERCCTVRK